MMAMSIIWRADKLPLGKMEVQKINLKTAVLGFSGMSLVGCILLIYRSILSQNHDREDHRDKIDLTLSQANDYFLDGNLQAAVNLVDKAQEEAHSEINSPRRRGQLVTCAMDYCGYNQKDKALAVLKLVLPFNDVTGQQARQVFDGITRGDRIWQPMHIPNSTERAQLKALKARLLNDPTSAKQFIKQYTK